MKKNLLLLRHAEAVAYAAGKTDHQRPLTPRGTQQAHAMSELLHTQGFVPDLVYSSNAQRTTSTAEIFAQKLNYPTKNIIFDPSIYETMLEVMLDAINKIAPQHQKVLMIGHNPTISYLTEYLTGQSVAGLPNCGIASIVFEAAEWAHVSADTGVLAWLKHP
ncbi:histidine phosphatase family protein [uncultured Microscilla sp.]|uniref:SixA phosphatase family protein n=1 Tax=uncultured Microscilla sp. TaxID=432653 RepID=UPI00262A914F|nr:histidine phosphatase family protein [uncultured Microscilla sp.]